MLTKEDALIFAGIDTKPKVISWDDLYIDIAERIAKRSHCARLNVGVVIVTRDYERIVGLGYNGNYRGGPNECDTDIPGACGCIHAEVNALTKAGREARDCYIYCSIVPCLNCSKLIINSGATRVLYGDTYRNSDGHTLLTRTLGEFNVKWLPKDQRER